MISDDKRANSLDTGNIKLTYNSVSIGIMLLENLTGVQWLGGRGLNLRLRGPWYEAPCCVLEKDTLYSLLD